MQAEARSDVLLRTSCEICRNRKLKCDGVPPSKGGCTRCKRDGAECHYRTRAPIGRPKGTTKFKMDEMRPRLRTSGERCISLKPEKGRQCLCRSNEASIGPNNTLEFEREGHGSVTRQHSHSMLSPLPLVAAAEAAAFSDPPSHFPYVQTNGSEHSHAMKPSHVTSPPTTLQRQSLNSTAGEPAAPYATLNKSPTAADDLARHHHAQKPCHYRSAASAAIPSQLAQLQSTSNSSTFDNYSSLASLEMAAYLDGLDRVEINPSDGLTPIMLLASTAPSQHHAALGRATRANGAPNDLPPNLLSAGGQTSLDSLITQKGDSSLLGLSQEDPWSGSFLDEAVSYAVPSDFSWWDVGLDPVLITTAPPLMPTPQPPSDSLQAVMSTKGDESQSPSSKQDIVWPHGLVNGMDSGLIRTEKSDVNGGSPWSNAANNQSSYSEKKPVKSCCFKECEPQSNWPIVPTALSWPGDQTDLAEDAETQVARSSCCALRKFPSPPVSAKNPRKRPCPRMGAASCCCGRRYGSERKYGSGVDEDATAVSVDPSNLPSRSALSTAMGHSSDTVSSDASSPRVHCMPNLSGTGCTCMCETDVCLLRVTPMMNSGKRFRSVSEIAHALQEGAALYDEGDSAGGLSLHLTLSASQAVSASCACSSTCPTCRSDPSSSSYNASLLISLALQIYARAVRILRDGFAGDSHGVGAVAGADAAGSDGTQTDSMGSGLEIKIGGYRPSKKNARKIALLAMRLELTDLEGGMGRVWQVASGEENEDVNSVGTGSDSQTAAAANFSTSTLSEPQGIVDQRHTGRQIETGRDRRLPPLDCIIICKLREQLREMISRVEALEKV